MLVLRGHRGPVVGLAYSPDGRMLASASADGTARLWDVGTGREMHKMQSPSDRARCVAFSRDGRLLAVGYERPRGYAQLWELPAIRRREQWAPHEQSTRAMGFAEDNGDSRLVTCGDNRALAVWALPATVPIWCKEGTAYHGLGIFPTGRGFATIEHSIARIRIWEFRGQIVFKHKTAIPPPVGIRTGSCLAISPSAKWVAAGLESTSGRGILARSELDVRHPKTASWPAHNGSILGVAFFHDSQSLLSAATDGLVKHWSLTGELLRTIDWQIGELGAVAIAPDGLTAAVGGAEDIVVWDLEA